MHRLVSEDSKDKRQAIIAELVTSANSGYRPAVEELLKDLFPPATWDISSRTVTSNTYPKWEATLRVCHDRIFDRYFHLALPHGQLSQALVERTLGTLMDARALTAELLALKGQGLLDAMLTRHRRHSNRECASSTHRALQHRRRSLRRPHKRI